MVDDQPDELAAELERFQPLTESEQRELSRDARALLAEGPFSFRVFAHREGGRSIEFYGDEPGVTRIVASYRNREDARVSSVLRITGDVVRTESRHVDAHRSKDRHLEQPLDLAETRRGDVIVCREFFDNRDQFEEIDHKPA
jgi:hypothetical protein